MPDREERFEEIYSGLKRRLASGFIREYIGEGNDQLVDDMFTSNDGRYIYASRPSFADVVAIDINSGEIFWRTRVEGLTSGSFGHIPRWKNLFGFRLDSKKSTCN